MKLVFLLGIIFFFDTCSAEVKAKFGCQFDSNYNLLNPAQGTDMRHHVQPVWGQVGIARFENENQFNDFLFALRQINVMVVQGNQYNTIDNLLTFYKDYKNSKAHSNRTLNDFFVQYKETDKPSDGAGLTIQMVNKMIAMHPAFTTQMLASSLSTCVSGDFGTLTEDQLRVEPHLLPVKNYNDRVMGVLRFKIGIGKMGYIVMDPAHALMDILVILDSDIYEKDIDGITHDPMLDIKSWHWYRKSGDYIQATAICNSMKKRQTRKSTMCYIGKSFCSYENASRKPGLVLPSHSMVVHDDKWIVQGGMFVNLYETKKYDGRVVLWSTDITGGPTVLKFENTKQLNEQLKKGQKHKKVYVVGKAFGKTPKEMDELLAKIGIMIDDRDFTSQMKGLYDWFSK